MLDRTSLMKLIGMMSGTSMDGVDVAIVDVVSLKEKRKVQVLATHTFPYPRPIQVPLEHLIHSTSLRNDVFCELHFKIGAFFAKSAHSLVKKARLSMKEISLIGSHGQTVSHLGRKGSLQIGDPSVIANQTGVTTIGDFRSADIGCGGMGAPITPYVNTLLFHSSRKNRVIHNLGGISNVTLLPADKDQSSVTGFDTGPANMMSDALMKMLTDGKKHYDRDGKMAAKGTVSLKWLHELMEHPFILKKPPKSSGHENFGNMYTKKMYQRAKKMGLSPESILATVVAFTASSIGENYRNFIFPLMEPDEIIFGGGGCHHQTLMKMIEKELPGIQMSTFDDYGIPLDSAEAVSFALFAHELFLGRKVDLSLVTGSQKPCFMGKICPGDNYRNFSLNKVKKKN